jgi:hypothetical protein
MSVKTADVLPLLTRGVPHAAHSDSEAKQNPDRQGGEQVRFSVSQDLVSGRPALLPALRGRPDAQKP